MAHVNANKTLKGPLINKALCRCCRSIKKCRLLTAEYEFKGSKEVYCDMFTDVFGLHLPHLDGDSMECCICAICVSRLREASDFRKQVLQSEQLLLDSRLKENTKNVKLEVKMEPTDDSDIHDNIEDHNDDSEIETNIDRTIQTVDVTKIKSLNTTSNKMEVEEPLSTADKIRKLYTITSFCSVRELLKQLT